LSENLIRKEDAGGLSINQIYNMDCLEYMDMLIKQGVTVDAIITDPPY
jgi:DNA modification methylase